MGGRESSVAGGSGQWSAPMLLRSVVAVLRAVTDTVHRDVLESVINYLEQRLGEVTKETR